MSRIKRTQTKKKQEISILINKLIKRRRTKKQSGGRVITQVQLDEYKKILNEKLPVIVIYKTKNTNEDNINKLLTTLNTNNEPEEKEIGDMKFNRYVAKVKKDKVPEILETIKTASPNIVGYKESDELNNNLENDINKLDNVLNTDIGDIENKIQVILKPKQLPVPVKSIEPINKDLNNINKNLNNKYDKDKISKKYEASTQLYSLIANIKETLDKKKFRKLRIKLGILGRMTNTEESVKSIWKKLHTVINTETSANPNERKFCLWFITFQICNKAKKSQNNLKTTFALAYFMSFVMAEYKEEYEPIFNACFHHLAPFTMPYFGNSLDKLILDPTFDALKPSKERCLALGYSPIKEADKELFEQNQIQVFGNDKFEPEGTYFVRMTNLCALYAAFMTIKNRNQVQEEESVDKKQYTWPAFQNPIGIGTGKCAVWLRNLISQPKYVYPEICAILASILPLVGHDMLLSDYSATFILIVEFIEKNQLAQSDISTKIRKHWRDTLNIFYENTMTLSNGQMVIKPHEDSKVDKFQKANAEELTNFLEEEAKMEKSKKQAAKMEAKKRSKKKRKKTQKNKVPVKNGGSRKSVRKHRGIVQTGGSAGRLRKGYKYTGRRLKNGQAEIKKVKQTRK
jgi:hypothetical protein